MANLNNQSQEISEENRKIEEILLLFEESYSCSNNERLNSINEKIKTIIETDFNNYINLLFKCQSLTTFNNRQITLNLHKSIAINIKNVIIQKYMKFSNEYIMNLFEKIFGLYLSPNSYQNQNLFHFSIFDTFNEILDKLTNSKSLNIENFEKILKSIIPILTENNSKNYPYIANSTLCFGVNLFTSDIVNSKNCLQLFIEYYLPIFNDIFKKINSFINPNEKICDNEFIILIKNLLNSFYIISKKYIKLKGKDLTQLKKIIFDIYNNYSSFIFELLKFNIPLSSESEIFGTQNNIILFDKNLKKFDEFNYMKAQCLQFFSFCIEVLTEKSNNDKIIKIEIMNNLNIEIIKLIVKSFECILNNSQQYIIVKNYFNFAIDISNSIDHICFQMIVFLSRTLFREPIKTFFKDYMQHFILNIIFPLIVSTNEESQLFQETQPESYYIYLKENIDNNSKGKMFRPSLCYFIKKIYLNYKNLKNFILIYVIEMLSSIISENSNNYVYFNEKNKSLITNLSDEIKVDFCFFITLILKEELFNDSFLLDYFYKILSTNQEKIHKINSVLVLVKLCEIYKKFLPCFIKRMNIITRNKNKIYYLENFVKQAIKFLIQNLIINNLKKKNNFQPILLYVSFEVIYSLCSNIIIDENNFEDNFIKELVYVELKFNLKFFIDNLDECTDSFYLIIKRIISEIKIENHSYISEFLNKLSHKFSLLSLSDKNNESFIIEYFDIIANYLAGENKFGKNNITEIDNFHKIFDPLLDIITNNPSSQFCVQIITISTYYLNIINKINDRCLLILRNIIQIINNEQTLSYENYEFISKVLSLISNDMENKNTDMCYCFNETINDIIDIIKFSISMPKDFLDSNEIFCYSLFLKILCFNPKNITYDIIEFFFSKIPDIINNLSKNNLDAAEKFTQISTAIFSIGFIYFPENVVNIFETNDVIFSNYYDFSEIENSNFYYSLGKCAILGLCNITNNKNLFNNLFDNNIKKSQFMIIFISLVYRQKSIVSNKLTKLTEKELKINAVEDENNKNDLDEFDEFDNDFEQKMNEIISNNKDINQCDEFQCFNKVINDIRDNNKELFSLFINKLKENGMIYKLEEIMNLRNIKVSYQGKEYIVPRKMVKIKRSVN